MTPAADDTATYLGFDLSTQKLKAVVLSSKLEVKSLAEVKFDTDLPEFHTTGGVNQGSKNNEFYAHPVMWIKAIDIVMDRLIEQGVDFNSLAAISGSGQQHGSVYWSENGLNTLAQLKADKYLHLQLKDSAFTITKSPIWMDGSTETQCVEMEDAVGARMHMVHISGSKCYPRFTGPQIRKIYQQQQIAYENTRRISLVSSFLASIFLGAVAPIDFADGSGMNLFDINNKKWSTSCLNACAPNLEKRLGQPTPTISIVGNICDYFVKRYGFSKNCKIVAFTGDNPSALSGMVLAHNSLVISLGTSDTIIMNLEEHPKLEEGHVLCHPIQRNEFMGLLCFRNGSLVRDAIKASDAEDNWDKFNKLLNSAPKGNAGNMALHFVSKEIVPNAKGILRWSKNIASESIEAARGLEKFRDPHTEIRALVEGQMLHRRAIAEDMGFHFGKETQIIATGGASVNKSLLQVISDVFDAKVYVQRFSEAALLGAAYRAKYALYLEEFQRDDSTAMSYHDYIVQFIPNHIQLVCTPSPNSHQIYTPMVQRYREMAKFLEQTK